jgi:hypothetical protein
MGRADSHGRVFMKSTARAVCRRSRPHPRRIEIEDVPHSHAAADRAVQLADAGEVDAVMKDSLHTDELMGAVVARKGCLRTKRRVTHCFLMQMPAYPRRFTIIGAVINIAPQLGNGIPPGIARRSRPTGRQVYVKLDYLQSTSRLSGCHHRKFLQATHEL